MSSQHKQLSKYCENKNRQYQQYNKRMKKNLKTGAYYAQAFMPVMEIQDIS